MTYFDTFTGYLTYFSYFHSLSHVIPAKIKNILNLRTSNDCMQQIFVAENETDLIIIIISLQRLDIPLNIQ